VTLISSCLVLRDLSAKLSNFQMRKREAIKAQNLTSKLAFLLPLTRKKIIFSQT